MPTREEILRAAEQVLQQRGVAHTTTRAIAEEAGCAEGSIYNHFAGKDALIHDVITARAQAFLTGARDLVEHAGTATVADNLRHIAAQAVVFFRQLAPMLGAGLADPVRLEQHRASHRQDGPARTHRHLVAYLERERDLGRVDAQADLDGATAALLGACFHLGVLSAAIGPDPLPLPEDDYLTATIAAVVRGLEPAKEA